MSARSCYAASVFTAGSCDAASVYVSFSTCPRSVGSCDAPNGVTYCHIAIAASTATVFVDESRSIYPAHSHLHPRRRNVFACTLTFLGPERVYCRRQLRSAPGRSRPRRVCIRRPLAPSPSLSSPFFALPFWFPASKFPSRREPKGVWRGLAGARFDSKTH